MQIAATQNQKHYPTRKRSSFFSALDIQTQLAYYKTLSDCQYYFRNRKKLKIAKITGAEHQNPKKYLKIKFNSFQHNNNKSDRQLTFG